MARRIAGWTSNLLATALILVAGLTFGRHVVLWWRTPPGPPAGGPEPAARLTPPDPGAGWTEVVLGAGRAVLEQVDFYGDADALLERLGQLCRRRAAAAPPPAGEPGPAEAALLARLAGQPPAGDAHGACRIYWLERPMPLAIAVSRPAGGPETVGRRPRVVCWALGLPLAAPSGIGGSAAAAWRILLMAPGPASEPGEAFCPPGGRPVLAVRAADGGLTAAATGPGDPGRWGRWYERRLEADGWRLVRRRGEPAGGGWSEFERPDGRRAAVLVRPEGAGRTAALVVMGGAGAGRAAAAAMRSD